MSPEPPLTLAPTDPDRALKFFKCLMALADLVSEEQVHRADHSAQFFSHSADVAEGRGNAAAEVASLREHANRWADQVKFWQAIHQRVEDIIARAPERMEDIIGSD